jgi:flagellar motor switch protein FliM
MKKESLTKEELESLKLFAEIEGPKEPEEEEEGEFLEPVRYDFSRKLTLTAELRTLEDIFNKFGNSFRSWLSSYLRAVLDIKMTGEIQQLAYREFIESLETPTYASTFFMSPLKGASVLQFDLPLVYAFIDKLLGGEGRPVDDESKKELSEIEAKIMEKISINALSNLEESWRSYIEELKIEYGVYESMPQFIELGIMPDDTVILAQFDVSIQIGIDEYYTKNMRVCIPYVVLQPVKSMLQPGKLRSPGDEATKLLVERKVRSLKLPIRCVLGEDEMTLGELLELKPGDIIPLKTPIDSPAVIVVGNIPRFEAKPGVIRGRQMGFKILREIKEEEEGEGETNP